MLIRDPLSRLARIEALAALVAATTAYAIYDHGWGTFALYFLIPDLFMLGYLAGRGVGRVSYNVAHSFASPAVLAVVGLVLGISALLPLALIWYAHVGFDRALGMGPVK